MKIKWLGHCTFLITSETGVRIITDPYDTAGRLIYKDIDESADVVTVTHDHFDHNNISAVRGNPVVVTTKTTTAKGIEFKAVASFHDDVQGREMGLNTIICFTVDGVSLCHLGDLGQGTLTSKQLKEIGKVDVAFVPVGGVYTIDAEKATAICEQLKPKVIFPIHCRSDRMPNFPGTTVDPFLAGKKVVRKDTSELEFTPATLPREPQVFMLHPAL